MSRSNINAIIFMRLLFLRFQRVVSSQWPEGTIGVP